MGDRPTIRHYYLQISLPRQAVGYQIFSGRFRRHEFSITMRFIGQRELTFHSSTLSYAAPLQLFVRELRQSRVYQ